MTSGGPFQPTRLIHFEIYWYDGEEDRLSWSFSCWGEQIFQGCIYTLFPLSSEIAVQMARLYCSANKCPKSKRKLRYTVFFPTVLYLLRKQIAWHFCNIFYSEIARCIAVINKSNLSSSTNGKLRARSWFLGPSGRLWQSQKYNLMSWFPVQYSDSKAALPLYI